MLINFVDATNDANHYTKPPQRLVQECTMLRDGRVRLPDAFTVGDFTDIACFLCIRVDCSLLSIFLCFFCTSCTIYIINKWCSCQ